MADQLKSAWIGTQDTGHLDGNYVLTLSPAEKGNEADFAVIVATPEFSLHNGDPGFDFVGKLTPVENGVYLLTYYFEAGTAITKSSVLLRPGEPAQIVKNGKQFYNLKLDRYSPSISVKAAPPAATPTPIASH